jgi:hypothetical protein
MIFDTKKKKGFPYKFIQKEDLCEKYLDDEQKFWDFGTQPITNPKDIIDTTKTGFSNMDNYLDKSGAEYMINKYNRKGEIVLMSPNEYFEECANHAWVNSTNTANSLKRSRRVDTDVLSDIKTVLTHFKRKLCLPYIDYASPGQEGLHRMMVIGDMYGWDFKVPVLVVTIADEEEENRRIKVRRNWYIEQEVTDACNRAFYYTYQDIDEFKDQLQWELDRKFQYSDEIQTPVKFDLTVDGEILSITVDGVTCEFHISVLEFEDKKETSDDDFDISEDDLDDLDNLLNI